MSPGLQKYKRKCFLWVFHYQWLVFKFVFAVAYFWSSAWPWNAAGTPYSTSWRSHLFPSFGWLTQHVCYLTWLKQYWESKTIKRNQNLGRFHFHDSNPLSSKKLKTRKLLFVILLLSATITWDGDGIGRRLLQHLNPAKSTYMSDVKCNWYTSLKTINLHLRVCACIYLSFNTPIHDSIAHFISRFIHFHSRHFLLCSQRWRVDLSGPHLWATVPMPAYSLAVNDTGSQTQCLNPATGVGVPALGV